MYVLLIIILLFIFVLKPRRRLNNSPLPQVKENCWHTNNIIITRIAGYPNRFFGQPRDYVTCCKIIN